MGFQLFLTSLIALFLLSIPLCIMSYEPPAGGAVHGRDAVPAAAAQARGAGHGHDQGLQLHALLHQPHAGHAQGGGREARPVLGGAGRGGSGQWWVSGHLTITQQKAFFRLVCKNVHNYVHTSSIHVRTCVRSSVVE